MLVSWPTFVTLFVCLFVSFSLQTNVITGYFSYSDSGNIVLFIVFVYYYILLIQPPPKPGNFSASQMARYVAKYKAAFALKALVTRQRGTHPKGVGAIGTVTVLDNPLLPKHEFFEEGRVFPLRLRHANLVRPDDAQLDVRAVSLKFADNDFESPFDLMMHTGEEAAFWNIVSFDHMLTALAGGPKTFKAFCLEDPWQ